MTNDHQNNYLYDADGHICAIQGASGLIGYLYDAQGRRVATGTLTSLSCNPAINGFQATNVSVIGLDGKRLTDLDGSGDFVDTNVKVAVFRGDGHTSFCRIGLGRNEF